MEEERERSLGTRAYCARVAYERCVSRSAGVKWLSFNFTARAAPTPRSNTKPYHTCHSLGSRVFWGYLAKKRESKGRYFTAFGNAAGYRGKKEVGGQKFALLRVLSD